MNEFDSMTDWYRDRTIHALEAAGHLRVDQEKSNRLIGPFEARRSGINGFEIVSSDGTTGVWVIGEENANELVKLMTQAQRLLA